MISRAFIEQLRGGGRVRVGRELGTTGAELAGLEADIVRLEAEARAELVFEAPELVMKAASWAFLTLYRGCQFLAYRELSEALVEEVLSLQCREKPSPAVCWSVDLAFRCLPDLVRLARGVAPGDPLVARLSGLAAAWPLSSVGVPGVGAVDVDPFIGHRALAQLYVDRIVETGDAPRLADTRVLSLVRASLGDHPELAPRLGPALYREQELTA